MRSTQGWKWGVHRSGGVPLFQFPITVLFKVRHVLTESQKRGTRKKNFRLYHRIKYQKVAPNGIIIKRGDL